MEVANLVALVPNLTTVFVVFEIKPDKRKELIACIDDRDRATKLHESGRCEVHEMIVNPLKGSYLTKLEKEIEAGNDDVQRDRAGKD